MQLTRWNPRNRVSLRNNLFSNQFDDFFSPLTTGHAVSYNSFIPSVDIFEKDETVFFEAEVPGFKKDDLKVDVKGKIVTISGERKEEKTEGENNYRRERRYGRFERSFQLGFEADSSAVKAKYENGILTLEVPKPEEQKVKQIQIH